MRIDLDVYGSAPMADPGAGLPIPVIVGSPTTRSSRPTPTSATGPAPPTGSGYDTMWLTEHHFQHEGYELTPNLVLFGLHLAGLTERLRFGQMFNVVPQWHPLRLAEDFAMADVLSGGRMVFGVGRGTVPREAQSLGAVVASGDNDMSRDADALNREMFEESMEVILAAWRDERFTLPRQALLVPARRHPRSGQGGRDAHADPPPARRGARGVPAGDVAEHLDLRGPQGLHRRVRQRRPVDPEAALGHLRRGVHRRR